MTKLVFVGLAAFFSIVTSAPAAAVTSPGFDLTKIDGIRLSVRRDPGKIVFEDSLMLSPQNVCATATAVAGDLSKLLTDGFLVAVNSAVSKKTGGVSLARYTLALSPNCSGSTVVSPILNERADKLLMRVQLPGNRFTTNLTTPDASVLGVEVGAPQSMDPRISIAFDVDLDIEIPLPSDGSARFGAPRVRGSIHNISMPRGENPTGQVLALLSDVGTSIYDHFNNGLIGRTLGGGFAWSEAMPNAVISKLNHTIVQHAASNRQVSVNYVGNGILDVNFNSGEARVDPTCISGFVWREAQKGDLVCVTPEVRAQVRSDNRLANERAEPRDPRVIQVTGLCFPGAPCEAKPLPPRRCLPGFVWREAVENDFVCVTPETRAQAKQDNVMARRRRVDFVEVIH